MSTPWHADANEIGRFVRALFAYAESDTYLSLRAFDQFDRAIPPRFIRGIRVNGHIEDIIREATVAAEDTAQYPDAAVFCPPIATFKGAWKAGTTDLANGLTLSVELDDADPDTALTRLQGILGPVTVVVRSGSEWTDATTGEIKPKVHLHWRLSEPTTTQEDHFRLNDARAIAALLTGADPTAAPPVHPLRWPGSWNLKTTPRMATIAVLNEAAEINLDDALEALELAAEGIGNARRDAMPGALGDPQAKLLDIRSAMAAIPNPDDAADGSLHYAKWVRYGIAIYRATGGAPEGFEIFDNWSRLSDKYERKGPGETLRTWRAIASAVKNGTHHRPISAGTIFLDAMKNGWVRPFPFGSTADPLGNGHDSNGFDASEDTGQGRDEPRSGIRLYTMRELDALPPPEWIIEGLIPENALVVPFGPPKSGKTFIVLSMCLHVSAGRDWFGYPVRQGGVVYIAGEGSGGLQTRLRAMRSAYQISIDEPFWTITRAVNFRQATEVTALAEAVRATVGNTHVRMVVIDTLARAMPGADENSAQEVGLVIAGCDALRDELGCSTMPIHHSGKDTTKGARGTSALRGAWDTALEITAAGQRTIMTVADQKEAEAGQRLVFRMDKIAISLSRSSLVPMLEMSGIAPEEGGEAPSDRGLRDRPMIALQSLRDALASEDAAVLPWFAGKPDGDVTGLHVETWRRKFYERMPSMTQEARKKAFQRVVEELTKRRLVGVSDPWVWLVK